MKISTSIDEKRKLKLQSLLIITILLLTSFNNLSLNTASSTPEEDYLINPWFNYGQTGWTQGGSAVGADSNDPFEGEFSMKYCFVQERDTCRGAYVYQSGISIPVDLISKIQFWSKGVGLGYNVEVFYAEGGSSQMTFGGTTSWAQRTFISSNMISGNTINQIRFTSSGADVPGANALVDKIEIKYTLEMNYLTNPWFNLGQTGWTKGGSAGGAYPYDTYEGTNSMKYCFVQERRTCRGAYVYQSGISIPVDDISVIQFWSKGSGLGYKIEVFYAEGGSSQMTYGGTTSWSQRIFATSGMISGNTINQIRFTSSGGNVQGANALVDKIEIKFYPDVTPPIISATPEDITYDVDDVSSKYIQWAASDENPGTYLVERSEDIDFNIKTQIASGTWTSGEPIPAIDVGGLVDLGEYYFKARFYDLSGNIDIDIQTTSVIRSLSGYEFSVSNHPLANMEKEMKDYRESIHFSKPANVHAQMYREFTELSGKTFEVKASFNKENVESSIWSPSLRVEYDNGFSLQLTDEGSNLKWLYAGAPNPVPQGGSSNNPFTSNTWYDMRIQILNHIDMQKYALHFDYKNSSSTTWIELASVIVTATLGIPTISIGTPRLDDSSNTGVSESYWFADFSARSIEDQDGDGLTDQEEFDHYQSGRLSSTSMATYDSDGDGLSDGEELNTGIEYTNYTTLLIDMDNPENSTALPYINSYLGFHSNPLDSDTDNDNLSDGEEMILGSDPNKMDTDNDGVMDNIDREPTVIDTFAPSFVDINGLNLTVNGRYFEFTDDGSGEGVYSWVEKRDGFVFIIFRVYDDSGVDHADVWSTDGIDFSHSWDQNGEQEVWVSMIYDFNNWVDKTIHVSVTDGLGYETDDWTFEVAGLLSPIIRPITNFVSNGINWISDNVGAFWDWASNAVVQIKEAVEGWISDKLQKLLQYISKSLKTITNSLTSTLEILIKQFAIILSEYTSNSDIVSMFSPIIENNPVSNALQPAIDFLENYETELYWAQKVLGTVTMFSDPSKLASFLISTFGSSVPGLGNSMISDLISGSAITGTLISHTLVQAIDLIPINLDSPDPSELGIIWPSAESIEAFIDDLDQILDSQFAGFITDLYNGFKSSTQAQMGLSLNEGISQQDLAIAGFMLSLDAFIFGLGLDLMDYMFTSVPPWDNSVEGGNYDESNFEGDHFWAIGTAMSIISMIIGLVSMAIPDDGSISYKIAGFVCTAAGLLLDFIGWFFTYVSFEKSGLTIQNGISALSAAVGFFITMKGFKAES